MEIATDIMNISFTLMFISIAYLFKKSYPKEMNSMIGYRTKNAMRSQENWIRANAFSSRLLFKYTLMLPVVQIVLYFIFGSQAALLGMLGLWLLLLLITLFQTEKMLGKQV